MSAPSLPQPVAEHVRPLARTEYERLAEAGVFGDEPIELLEGFLVEMSPEGAPHTWVIEQLTELLVLALAGSYHVRIGHPLALGDLSEPEPDVAVVPRGDYRSQHPQCALLVIESSHSSRRIDLGFKAELYARHDVPEYWVVDLETESVVVHRDPREGGYGDVSRVSRGAVLVPEQVGGVELRVDDILP
jgi:Uma2 family endonuclease